MDSCRVIIGDLDVKLLLELHYQFNRFDRVGAEIFDKRRVERQGVSFWNELVEATPDPP